MITENQNMRREKPHLRIPLKEELIQEIDEISDKLDIQRTAFIKIAIGVYLKKFRDGGDVDDGKPTLAIAHY